MTSGANPSDSGNQDESKAPAPDRALDKRGGPGHSVLLLVILMLPALKVAWTVGEGAATRDIVTTMGIANWPNIVVGMMLSDPAFASLLAIVVSRISFGYFAARGAVPRGDDAASRARVLTLAFASPIAYGVLVGVFFGPWWALFTATASAVLRHGVVVEYRAGRRGNHPERRATSTTWERRSATAGHLAALVLTAVVLPVVALADAFDGRAWAPVVHCSVDYGQGPHRARLIELDRVGNGIVGWDTGAREIANGLDCAAAESDVIRAPWWRS